MKKLPSQPASSSHEIRHSLAWMVVSCLLFSLVMVSVRWFLFDLPSMQSVFLRYAIGVLMLLPFVGSGLSGMWRSPERVPLAARSVMHAVAVFLWFYGVIRIPLADVNALLNLGPVYATLGAAMFMGERLRLRRISAICVAFAGAMIIIQPGFQEVTVGMFAIMLTAPLFAASDLLAKRLKRQHNDNFIIMSLSAGIGLLVLLPAIAVWQPMTTSHWIGVLAIASSATAGHVTMMRSFRGPMWAAQTGKYIQLLFVVLFGIALFDEIPTFATIAGALVVLGGVSYIAIREGRAIAPVH